jgi:hypothetical protein
VRAGPCLNSDDEQAEGSYSQRKVSVLCNAHLLDCRDVASCGWWAASGRGQLCPAYKRTVKSTRFVYPHLSTEIREIPAGAGNQSGCGALIRSNSVKFEEIRNSTGMVLDEKELRRRCYL